ncbi:hypothetical protein [Desulfosudis oleivorans]|uniref:hypothetical protein n=1 Tax=Desulfosudis oleivorans TaxID=181663 RepID=UPI001E432284|nr:hypothetical protein [Desulfosudis oleivorans]
MINDIGLAALTLLVAESDPANKDVMIRLIMNMLAGRGKIVLYLQHQAHRAVV